MTPKQEEALRDYLQEVITPLIEQVLVKKLGQAMTFAKQELIQPKREWVGLTELEKAEITSLKWWDWEDTFDIEGFIRAIEAKLKEKNT
jgi:hypothetical protein